MGREEMIMTLEIINSSIIELNISLNIPANNIIEQIHIIATLPAGLTYAKNIGTTIKKTNESEWKKDGIIDKSSDVELDETQIINHSQINLILDQSLSRQNMDTNLELHLPVAVYDADLLIKVPTLDIEVKLSSDLKTYSSEFIPLQFKFPILDLYGHCDTYIEKDLPVEGKFKFYFQTLNSLAPTSDSWTYQLIIYPIEEIKLNYPFSAFISKTFKPLKITTTIDYVEYAYIITIPHQNEQKGEPIFIEIPYLLNTSVTTHASLPVLFNQEAELHFYKTTTEIKDLSSTACSQIKILETPPTYLIKINAITLK